MEKLTRSDIAILFRLVTGELNFCRDSLAEVTSPANKPFWEKEVERIQALRDKLDRMLTPKEKAASDGNR